MRLTGKCKGAFEKWYMNSSSIYFSAGYHEVLSRLYGVSHEGELSVFYHSPESMQYGVYEAFYRKLNIFVVIIPSWKNGKLTFRVGFHYVTGSIITPLFLRPSADSVFFIEFDEYNKARTAAIEKANEIYNER